VNSGAHASNWISRAGSSPRPATIARMARAASCAATMRTTGAMTPTWSQVGTVPGSGGSGMMQRRHGVRPGTTGMIVPTPDSAAP